MDENSAAFSVAGNRFERYPIITFVCFILIIIIITDLLAARIFIGKDNSDKFRTRNIFYHHDLKKNANEATCWGSRSYKMITNSAGFRDASNRVITPYTTKKRVIFMGDSFTEGIGMPYEKTFVGILDNSANPAQAEVLNVSVLSYCPKLYYLKLKFLIENVGMKIDKLYIFIDMSDIQDEIHYEYFEPPMFPRETDSPLRRFLMRHSIIANLMNNIRISILKRFNKPLKKFFGPESFFTNNDFEIAYWTVDKDVFDRWGRKGLSLAEKNMQNLVDLCKKRKISLTIAVYPWPEQIKNHELNSLQESFWSNFAKKNNIAFIDYFPDFINNAEPEQVISKYFIHGDIHLNEEGHRLIASRIKLF